MSNFIFYFMLSKVAADEQLLRRVGTVAKRLFGWMGERNYIPLEMADDGVMMGQRAYRVLPKADKVAAILYDYASRCPLDPDDLEDKGYLEFDHYTVEKVELGKIWLNPYDEEVGIIGPVPVPEEAGKLIEKDWEIGCSMGRHQGKWVLMEMGDVHVYPE